MSYAYLTQRRLRQLPLSTRLVLLGGLLVVAAGASYLFVRTHIEAQTLELHPASCLGGWRDPAHAEGAPETGNNPLPERFTDENSAVLPANTSAEIYCGGFSADIPPDTHPRNLVVALSLSTGEAPQTIIGDNFASSSGQVLDAPDGSELRIVEPEPSPEVPPKQGGPPAEEPAPEPAPEPIPEPEPSPAPEPPSVSLIERIVRIAHAQETESDAVVPVPESGVSNLPNGEFLEVRYTFDGKTWQTLDILDREHATSQSFSVPLPAGATWEDLSDFQVSLRAVGSIDKTPKLYLDGMTLSIEYESLTPEAMPLSDPILPEDFTYYHVQGELVGDDIIRASVRKEGEQDVTVFRGKSGTNFRVYKLSDPTFSLSVGVGDGDVELPTYLFGAGDFVLIDTSDSGGCATIELLGCRNILGYLGEVDFTIVLERPLPVGEATTTPSTDGTGALPEPPPDIEPPPEVIEVPPTPVPEPAPEPDATLSSTP